LTVRELAALQTFPDDFVFQGATISQQQQVGNSVPPLFAKILAECVLEMIKKEN
jgi:DNA (cytosine-5)-methyltransferase 1